MRRALHPASAVLVAFSACSSSDGGGDEQGRADAAGVIDAAPPDAPPPPVCPDGLEVGFAADVQPIFDSRCTDTACHDGTGSAASLDLSRGKSHGELVGATAFQCDRTRVVPGDIDESYLVNKLSAIDMCSGTLMPKANERLPDDELAAVLAWICAGAADD